MAWDARRPFRSKLAIEATYNWGDRRVHDFGNAKAFYDSLNGVVWEDDGQIKDSRILVEYDEENPRVELRVWEL